MCLRPDIFTHNKVMLVKGFIRGKNQRYVMTGSANWSTPGLRSSDELITEIQRSKKLYLQYKANYNYQKAVVAKNSAQRRRRRRSRQTYMLQLSGSQQLDVRGLTDEQLAGQD